MTATATPTVTALQQRAARVLLTLLAQNLPTASWTVTPYIIGGPELAGQLAQLGGYHSLAERRAAIAAWADALGATPTLRRLQTPVPTHAASLRVLGKIDGVQVEVWIALTVEDLAELDAEPVPAVSGG